MKKLIPFSQWKNLHSQTLKCDIIRVDHLVSPGLAKIWRPGTWCSFQLGQSRCCGLIKTQGSTTMCDYIFSIARQIHQHYKIIHIIFLFYESNFGKC